MMDGRLESRTECEGPRRNVARHRKVRIQSLRKTIDRIANGRPFNLWGLSLFVQMTCIISTPLRLVINTDI